MRSRHVRENTLWRIGTLLSACPEELIGKARIESAKRDLSISAFLRDVLERELRPQDEGKEALHRFLGLARKNPIEMPEELWNREDLYE